MSTTPGHTARNRSISSAPRLESSALSIPSSSTVTMALLPVTVVFLLLRRKASPKCRVSLPTTSPKPRRKPTSLPTTAWRWTQAGMKNSCVWRLSPCRRQTSTRSSQVLTKKSCQSCLTMESKPKRTISMWMPSCKSLPSRSPATYGCWGGTDSSAVTAQKRKPTPPSWTAARRTSSSPTRPTM